MGAMEKSREIYEKARRIIPGGVNSQFRFIEPHPIYLSGANGSKIWDADGNCYTDYFLINSAAMLGHRYPKIYDAVKKQLDTGLLTGFESELTIDTAQKLSEIVPCAEMVNFSCTGSEAVEFAIHTARAYTGKDKIVKIEGGFNGRYDYVHVSVRPKPEEAGHESSPRPIPAWEGYITDTVTKNVFIVPFNNAEAMQKVIREHKDEIAAVIMEPVLFNTGTILPTEGYLNSVRELTERNDVLLIFDEVISGLRGAPGGAQEYYDVTPDLATFGKCMANGHPLSAVAGRKDIMELMLPAPLGGRVHHGGTFNAHHIAMAAASATLDEMKDGKVQKQCNELMEKLVEGSNEVATDLNTKLRMVGMGGIFTLRFTDQEVLNYRQLFFTKTIEEDEKKYLRIWRKLLSDGIFLWPEYLYHHSVSFCHSKEDVEALLKSLEEAISEI
jgi:glutamate-1-semialdehyde 2,1-aminomutase